ncbi:MAG: DUF721 domain-containing protein [Muribaculaceae bacterium]|nr:DUF721 domain-containing protein [Muribaculaceae bacterium]
MKRSDPLSIKELIDRVLDDDSVRDAARAQRLCYLWPEIVGQGINRYTTRRYVADGILHVYLSSAPLKNELQFHRSRLIDLLNQAVGADVITDIHIH